MQWVLNTIINYWKVVEWIIIFCLEHRECWHGEFKCKNSECIRPGYLCDGEVNCADGSDEEYCETGE